MSQWTHVNASIRFDAVLGHGMPTEKELGKICRFTDADTSHWSDSDLPCGSEGSIEYKIIKNPDDNHIAAAVVVFYGDLRDYDNVDEILAYFNRIVGTQKLIRSGILEIDVEFDRSLIYRHDIESGEWQKVAEVKND